MQEQQTGTPPPAVSPVNHTPIPEDDLSQPAPCIDHSAEHADDYCGQPWERQRLASRGLRTMLSAFTAIVDRNAPFPPLEEKKGFRNGPRAAQIPGYWKNEPCGIAGTNASGNSIRAYVVGAITCSVSFLEIHINDLFK